MTIHPSRSGFSLVMLLAITLMSGCGGDDNETPIAPPSGFLTVGLTDAPVDDAAEVIIVVTGIELPRGTNDTLNIDFETPRSINLLEFRDGKSFTLLEGNPLLPGEYSWLRLKIRVQENSQDGSRIRLRDGRQFPLVIPSGAESGLKLNRPFTVAQGSTTRLMIDFDLRKSLVAPPGQAGNWILRPTLRLVDQLQTGSAAGSVNVAALASQFQIASTACKPGLYIFKGENTLPDDMDGDQTDGIDPIVYLPLTPTTPEGVAEFRVAYLEAGRYTVATTCDFDVDVDPTRNEFNPLATPPVGAQPVMRFVRRYFDVSAGAQTSLLLP
jgi:hypothetical protein